VVEKMCVTSNIRLRAQRRTRWQATQMLSVLACRIPDRHGRAPKAAAHSDLRWLGSQIPHARVVQLPTRGPGCIKIRLIFRHRTTSAGESCPEKCGPTRPRTGIPIDPETRQQIEQIGRLLGIDAGAPMRA
jgi:hypothetical protein